MIDVVEGYLRNHVEALERLKAMTGHDKIILGDNHFEQYLLDFGEAMPWRPAPEQYDLGEPGQCYREAATLAIDNPGLRYVEGVAMNRGLIPLPHAWCIDEDGYVVDTTWHVVREDDALDERGYWGVVVERERLLELIIRYAYWGVLPFLIKEELGLDDFPIRERIEK